MPTTSQSCSGCGADVTHAKRYKDSKGQLFCAQCADRLRAGPAQRIAAGAPSALPCSPAQPEDGTLALADEVIARDEAFLHKPKYVGGLGADGLRDLELCPDCGSPWGSSVICTRCGHNRMTGEPVGVNVPPPAGEDPDQPRPPKPPKPCKKCGYDLTGLKSARCPECGTVNARLRSGQLTEKQTLKRMYTIPLVLTAIGVVVVLLIDFIVGAITGSSVTTSWATAGAASALSYVILFPLMLSVGFVVYVVCSMMFIGFDEPLGVTFVRLAAVYALTDVAQAIIRPIPFIGWFAVNWVIVGTIYVGLLMQIMELELEDAWFIAVLSFLVKLVVTVGAFYIYAKYF